MCFTEEQARKIVNEFKLKEDDLVDWFCEGAGAMYDYGPEDCKDIENRKRLVIAALRAIADMIELEHHAMREVKY